MQCQFLWMRIFNYLNESSLDKFNKISNILPKGAQDALDDILSRIPILSSNEELEEACCSNQIIRIQKTIENPFPGIDWNWGLSGACEGDHHHLMELMLELGADNMDDGLFGACGGGNLKIALLMIEKGASNYNYGLVAACIGGSVELAKLMLQKGALSVDAGLSRACWKNHYDVIQLMIENGAFDCCMCNQSMSDHLMKT